MKTATPLFRYSSLIKCGLTLGSLCLSTTLFAQIGSVIYSAPLVVGNNMSIGNISCAFDALNIVKGACTLKVSAANWCVNGATAAVTPVPLASSTTRQGATPVPASCATNVVVPFTLTTLCTGPTQPYSLTLQGVAYQRNAKPPVECKKPEKEREREREREKSDDEKSNASRMQGKDDKEGEDNRPECEDEKSSDRHDDRKDDKSQDSERSRTSTDSSASITSKNSTRSDDKKSDDKPRKDDDKEHEGSGSGSGSGGSGSGGVALPFLIKAQLPCQVSPAY